MTAIVFSLPQKSKPKIQRNITGPDVAHPVPGAKKAWARSLEDKRIAGDAGVVGEKFPKELNSFPKRQKLQPGQQHNGKGAESDGALAATEEFPVDQKLWMALGDIVNKSKAGKPTAGPAMGTNLGKQQHTKAVKAAASWALESQTQPPDNPQQQKVQQLKNPQQPHHMQQQQPQRQLQQQQQQQQPVNNSNRNNPNNPQYQYAQSLTACTVGIAGAGKAQKQAQRFNTINSTWQPLMSNDHHTDMEQLLLQDCKVVAVVHPKPRKARIAYAPQQVQDQQQSHKQQQQQRNFRQQQQQQQIVLAANSQLDSHLYKLQGGDDMMQDDADANAEYQQAEIWLDDLGQEHVGVEGFDDLDAFMQQQQQQPYQQQQQHHTGHVSGKKQRKPSGLAMGGAWSPRDQPQHGSQVMHLSDQNGYLDTDEQQQEYIQYDDQTADDELDEGGEDELQQQQQQQQQWQQLQQSQTHASSHGYSVMPGLHSASQNHEVAHHMPGLHGPPASLQGQGWADPHPQNHARTSHHNASLNSRMGGDGILDASLGQSRGAHGAGGPGQGIYDSYSSGQLAFQPNSSAQQIHAFDARHLIPGRRVVGWERESSHQPPHISMPNILLGSEQQLVRGQTADDSPGMSRRQRREANLCSQAKDTSHGQAHDRAEKYHQYGYEEPSHGQEHEHRMHSSGIQSDSHNRTRQVDQQQAATHTGRQGGAWPGHEQHRSELQPSAAAPELSAPVSRHRPAENYRAPVHSEQIRNYQRGDHLSNRQQERQLQWQQDRQPLPADLEPAGPAPQHHQRHTVSSRELSSEPDDTWDPRSRDADSHLYKVTQSAEPESAYVQPTLHPRMPQHLPRASAFYDARNGDDVRDPFKRPPDAYSPQRAHSFEPEEGEYHSGRSPSPVGEWNQSTQQGLTQPTEPPHNPPGARQHLHTQDDSPRASQQPSRKRGAEQYEYAGDGKRTTAYPHASRGPYMDEGTQDLTRSPEDGRFGVLHDDPQQQQQQQQQQSNGQQPRFKNVVHQAGIERNREGQSRLPSDESYQQAGRSARQGHQQQSRALLAQGRAPATTKPNSGPESSMYTAGFNDDEDSPNAAAVTWTAAAANGRTHTDGASVGKHAAQPPACTALPTRKNPNTAQPNHPSATLAHAPPLQHAKPQASLHTQAPRAHSPQIATTTSNHHPTAEAAGSRQAVFRAPLSLTNLRTSSPTLLNASAARPEGAAATGAQRSSASPAPDVISIDEDEATPEQSLATVKSGSKKQSVVTSTPAAPARPTPISYVQRPATAQPSTTGGTHRSMQHSNGAAVTLQQPAQPIAGTSQPVNTAAHVPPTAVGLQKQVPDTAGRAASTTLNDTAVVSSPAIRVTGYSPPNHGEPTRSSATVAQTAAPLNSSIAAAGLPVSTRVSSRTPIPAPQFPSRAAALQAAAAGGTTAPSTTAVTATAAAVPSTNLVPTAASRASTIQTAGVASVPADLSGSTTGAADTLQAPAGAVQAQSAAAAAMPNTIKAEAATATPAGVSSHASWRLQRKQQRMLQQQDEPAAAPCADEDAPAAATRKMPFIKQEPTRR